jgi:hypothetical protein
LLGQIVKPSTLSNISISTARQTLDSFFAIANTQPSSASASPRLFLVLRSPITLFASSNGTTNTRAMEPLLANARTKNFTFC